jgi:hypothetical protein
MAGERTKIIRSAKAKQSAQDSPVAKKKMGQFEEIGLTLREVTAEKEFIRTPERQRDRN